MSGDATDRWLTVARQVASHRGGALLALDTSASTASIALVTSAGAVEKILRGSRRASEELAPLIASLLEEQKVRATDLSAAVVGIGPGSFTGIRVGLALIKGMSFGCDLPLYPVSSFSLMAAAQAPGDVAVVTDNRGGQLFYGRYDVGDRMLRARTEDAARRPEDVARELRDSPPSRLIGDAAASVSALADLEICTDDEPAPRALAGIAMVADAMDAGAGQSAGAIAPTYLRLSSAEQAAG